MSYLRIFFAVFALFGVALSSCNNPNKEDQERFSPTPGGKSCDEEADY